MSLLTNEDKWNQPGPALTLLTGYRINKFIEVEASLHGFGSQSLDLDAQVLDPRLARNDKKTFAYQETTFRETTAVVAVIPRWQFQEVDAVFFRLGAGYTDTMLRSKLRTGCDSCAVARQYNQVESVMVLRGQGLSPVIGVGLDLGNVTRMEYQVRTETPVGNDKKIRLRGWFVSFRFPL